MSIKEIRTALKKLEQTGEIMRNGAQSYTLIKCCNYSLYQGLNDEEGQTKGTPRAHEGQTIGTQRATTNKYNKNNNKNNTNKQQRLKSNPSFDIDELYAKAVLNDDYDI